MMARYSPSIWYSYMCVMMIPQPYALYTKELKKRRCVLGCSSGVDSQRHLGVIGACNDDESWVSAERRAMAGRK